MRNIDELIASLKDENKGLVHKMIPLSWGNKNHCRMLFERIFIEVDKTITTFKFLPEYEAIVDWMVNTKGEGLYLWGDCGRGKSIILTSVIPMLFQLLRKEVRCIHSQQIFEPCVCNFPTSKPDGKVINLDYLLFTKYPIIDEIGVESIVNNYGTKIDGVSQAIMNAEHESKALFVSTNLDAVELMQKYDVRIVDRISRLCKEVKFKGDSLR